MTTIDKIYCLILSENTVRYEECQKTFKQIGIEDKINWWWTCKRSFSNTCATTIPNIVNSDYYKVRQAKNKNVFGNVFNCAIEHYTIIKTSYLRGYNNILIFEDDIRFNDIKFDDLVKSFPKDFDILVLYNGAIKKQYNGKNFIWKRITLPQSKYYISSTAGYVLNKKAMKTIIQLNDDYNLLFADNFFSRIDRKKIKVYDLMNNICYTEGISTIE